MLRLLKSGPCQETIAIIKWLLGQALSGGVLGMALCFRTKDRDVVIFTGIFRLKPESALAAGERIRQRAFAQMDLFT